MNNLAPRRINTRPTHSINDPELNALKSEVSNYISEIKSMTQLSLILDSSNSNELSMKEFIWRAQIVWICASLDYYLHRLQALGLFKIYDGIISPIDNKISINIPFKVVVELANGNKTTFVDDVYNSIKNYSYINYDQMMQVLNQFGIKIKEIAKVFFPNVSTNKAERSFETKFKEICDRRHLIAHKMDVLPNGQKSLINDTIVNDYINFIEKIILEIHSRVELLI